MMNHLIKSKTLIFFILSTTIWLERVICFHLPKEVMRNFHGRRKSVTGVAAVKDRLLVETKDVQGIQEGLKFRKLSSTSDIVVSELCLGTMMYGDQMYKEECFQQLDTATKQYGINFLDTAEYYPTPCCPKTCGRSQRIVGKWLKTCGIKRSDLVISGAVCGASELTWCRANSSIPMTRLSREQIIESVDTQLRLLGTDYLDVLQLHWPDRYLNLFGVADYRLHEQRADIVPFVDQLQTMDELIKAGKIRGFALSNESPYGVTSFILEAKHGNLPKPLFVSNPYNLLNRLDYDLAMAEACSQTNGDLSLVAYSPLGGGALSGKYLGEMKTWSRKSRLVKFPGYMQRYCSPDAALATEQYKTRIADKLDVPLAAAALAWVYSRPFVLSTIIAATTPEQLEDNVHALNIPMLPEFESSIEQIYRQYPDPTKGKFDLLDASGIAGDFENSPENDIDENYEGYQPGMSDAEDIMPWGEKDTEIDPDLERLIRRKLSKFGI